MDCECGCHQFGSWPCHMDCECGCHQFEPWPCHMDCECGALALICFNKKLPLPNADLSVADKSIYMYKHTIYWFISVMGLKAYLRRKTLAMFTTCDFLFMLDISFDPQFGHSHMSSNSFLNSMFHCLLLKQLQILLHVFIFKDFYFSNIYIVMLKHYVSK